MRQIGCLLVLFFGVTLSAGAEDRMEHGDWSSQFEDGVGEATTNENGMAMFGMLCGDGQCRYYFANGQDCEPGANHPLLVTTDQGAIALEAVCEPMSTANGEVLLYWFNEYPALNQAFMQSPLVGFAFALTGGNFKLNKFSMNGFSEALERMVQGMQQRMANEAPGATRSEPDNPPRAPAPAAPTPAQEEDFQNRT